MKRVRPWDRSFRKARREECNHTTATSSPSYVAIQGTHFFSDRFYLNEYEDTPAIEPSQCQCQRPPMFSRSALVETLSLKAAIVATYNLEIEAMVEEFPSIFKEKKVPCIILHGKKGLTRGTVERQLAQLEEDLDNEIEQSGDDDSVLGTTLNGETTCRSADHHINRLADHVIFSEIKTTWLSPLPASFNDVVCKETGCLRNEIIQKRKAKRGVHHPKYMILLEESGSIVVVVSTSNLTKSKRSVDGSWIQRFPPLPVEKRKKTPAQDCIGSELARLLQYQTLATAPDQMTVYSFAKRYMGWSSIFDVSTNYDYQQAYVKLVATVPGDYTCTHFGQQRLSEVTRKLPFALVSDKDRLVIQPTSIGAGWKDGGIVDLIRSYLQLDAEYGDTLRRLDIVWPTAHFIRNAGKQRTAIDPTFSPKRKGKPKLCHADEMKGFIFLSSDTFNRIDVDCLSRMVMYEPCETQNCILSPHFKSIVRLYEGGDYRIRKEYGFPKSQEVFSWFLLTSSCLSKGAQGDKDEDHVSYANFELGVLFSSQHGGNRCSINRVYCLKPQQCVCSSTSFSGAVMVPLPVPYTFRAPAYIENSYEAAFCETPFFHEITPETATCGNMQLTPYGRVLCKQTMKELC